MKILKITLQNITSHKDTTIEFKDGVNILLGKNGSGKSSVVKMIGYLLFNYIPEKKKELYIRNDENNSNPNTTATVSIEFEGNDKKQYNITRIFGSSATKIHVKELKSNHELKNVDSVSKLKIWLKLKMEFDSMTEPDRLFQYAIGVEQGTYISPFLDTKGNRKNSFGPLLNVNIYSEIWEKFRKIDKIFEKDENSLNLDIQKLMVRLDQKESIENDINNNQDILTNNHKLLHSSKNVLNEIIKKRADIEDIQKDIEKTSLLINSLTLNQQNVQNIINEINQRIIKSEDSDKICQDNTLSFEKYQILEEKKKLLEDKRDFLDTLKTEFDKFNLQRIELVTKLKDIQSNIDEIELKRTLIPSLQQKNEEFSDTQLKFTDINNKLIKIDLDEIRLQELLILIDSDNKKIQDIDYLLKNYDDISDLAQSYESENEKLHQKLTQKTILLTTLDNLKNDRLRTQDGNCPFLSEKCSRIKDGNLDNIFQEKIDKSNLELQKIEADIPKIKDIVLKSKNAGEELSKLNILKENKASIMKDLEKNRRKIDPITKQVKEKDQLKSQFTSLKTKMEDLKEVVDKFNNYKNDLVVKLPDLQSLKKIQENKLQNIDVNLNPITDKINNLMTIPQSIKDINDQIVIHEKGYLEYQNNLKISLELPSLKNKQQKLMQDFQKNNKDLSNANDVLKNLKDKIDNSEYKQLIEEENEIRDKIGIYKTKIQHAMEGITKGNAQLQEIQKIEEEYNKNMEVLVKMQRKIEFSKTLRTWFQKAQPEITKQLLFYINSFATKIYQELTEVQNIKLNWDETYDISLISKNNIREFKQLSGGEKMAAAISIRLAILKVLTNVDIVMFDEPTANLDESKRKNLAQSIKNISGFSQVFVISHDDTFENYADNIIKFEREEGEASRVSFLKT